MCSQEFGRHSQRSLGSTKLKQSVVFPLARLTHLCCALYRHTSLEMWPNLPFPIKIEPVTQQYDNSEDFLTDGGGGDKFSAKEMKVCVCAGYVNVLKNSQS